MITKIQRIDEACRECGQRADLLVTRTNDELPSDYFQGGQRTLAYCWTCAPYDAKAFWNNHSDFMLT